MKLVIVESPAKAKTIEKYLGRDYKVKASVGHIRDLPKSNKNAIDVAGGFIPHYEISRGKEHVVQELTHASQSADEVILATDPDREGEAIAWHVAEILKLKKPKRIVFHEITKEAIKEALDHPRNIDTNLRRAQEARRVLDRLFGYDLSGLIWKKVRYGLSAGRVQSPALRILVEREREINAFIPQKFFVITGEFEQSLILTCVEEPTDATEVERILTIGRKGNWYVTEVKETETKRSPRAPFTTSTIQQTASSRLGFSPSRTMRVAQKLYEKGHITYMRTDSTNLATTAQEQILKTVSSEFGVNYSEPHIFKTKSKNAQEAHEAIRPTHIEKKRCGGTPEEEKLYQLIRERALASQMKDAQVLKTKILANIKNSEIPDFSATGSRVIFPGWLLADPASRGEDIELPELKANDALKLKKLSAEEKETQPPPRYTEAGLVKELEKRGIGRPSTYASIIDTLEKRVYVVKDPPVGGRSLKPTDTGEVVSTFIEKNFGEYISDIFTAEMENELDEIARGEREYLKTLKDFYGPFSKEIKSKEKIEKLTTLGVGDKNIKCPTCNSGMLIKLGRNGRFLSCERYPECSGARKIDGQEMAAPKETGENCPECGIDEKGLPYEASAKWGGKLVEREGKFGNFIACSRYPKCKYVKKSEAEEEKKKTGVICPTCKKGQLTERRGRFGIFYSCSNYPNCKFAIKAKPTGQTCEKCNSLMMEGTKTIPERCSDKTCSNHNPHKNLVK